MKSATTSTPALKQPPLRNAFSDGKPDVSVVVRWTTGVGDARTDHSGNWQANLQKTQDGHCHVMGWQSVRAIVG